VLLLLSTEDEEEEKKARASMVASWDGVHGRPAATGAQRREIGGRRKGGGGGRMKEMGLFFCESGWTEIGPIFRTTGMFGLCPQFTLSKVAYVKFFFLPV
jgi:hypothetical protein